MHCERRYGAQLGPPGEDEALRSWWEGGVPRQGQRRLFSLAHATRRAGAGRERARWACGGRGGGAAPSPATRRDWYPPPKRKRGRMQGEGGPRHRLLFAVAYAKGPRIKGEGDMKAFCQLPLVHSCLRRGPGLSRFNRRGKWRGGEEEGARVEFCSSIDCVP